jgi:hypothetical protein
VASFEELGEDGGFFERLFFEFSVFEGSGALGERDGFVFVVSLGKRERSFIKFG